MDSLEAGMLPGRPSTAAHAQRRGRLAVSDEPRSRSRARWSARARRSWCSRRCAPGAWPWARGCPSSRRRFGRRLGVEHVSAVSSGTAGLHLAVRAAGVERGRRGRHHAVQLRGLRQLPALRGGAAGLLRHRPAHAQHRPGGRRRRGRRAHHRPASGAHLRLPGRHAGARAAGRRARAVDRGGRLRGARGRARRRRAGRRPRQPGRVRLLPEQAADDGGGRRGRLPLGAVKERIDSERNQGRAPDMGWLDHDRLGFNYRLDDLSCALGLAQLERLDELLAGRARVAGALLPGAGGHRGAGAALPRRGRRPAQLVRLRGAASAGRRPRRRRRGAARARRGLQALPARDPPDELLPRALRTPRGRVPGLRGRGAAVAGAALLPRARRRAQVERVAAGAARGRSSLSSAA